MSMLAIGIMSGTSIDAIDAVLVDFSADKPQLVTTHTVSFPIDIKKLLSELIETQYVSLETLGALDVALGKTYASITQQLIKKAGVAADKINVIGCHGQTICHHPHGENPFTIQLGNAHVLAHETGIPVVADFRSADIAAGGQGAPLAPLFHQAFFAKPHKSIAIVNLGGIANVSVLIPDQPVRGFDTGPANTLLDSWCQQHCGKPYDEDGAWAKTGAVIPELLDLLLSDPYFQQAAPKSTGREYFNLKWVEKYLAECPILLDSRLRGNDTAADIQHTLSLLTAHSITQALSAFKFDNVYICGGGVKNKLLFSQLQDLLPCPVTTTESAGIAPQWVEAAGFAWLAVERLKGTQFDCQPITRSLSPFQLGVIY